MKTLIEELAQVTRKMDLTPKEINAGNCDQWANEVYNRLQKTYGVEVHETPFGLAEVTHFFVRIEGLFRDASCLQGVKKHMDLPIFKKCKVGHQPRRRIL